MRPGPERVAAQAAAGMTPDTLARLRRKVPRCALAVWCDLDKGTVLAADGDLAYPQEHLDAMRDCAALLLRIAAPGTEGRPDSALFSGPTGCRVFLRMPGTSHEAICCLCGPSPDPEALLGEIGLAIRDASRLETLA